MYTIILIPSKMSEYDFALQWLDYRKIKVFNKGKQILVYKGEPNYEISLIKTKIQSGIDFCDDEEVKIFPMDYYDLQRMGFIIRAGTDILWRPRQVCYYKIMKKYADVIGLTQETYRAAQTRLGLLIEHDPKNRRVRLKGNQVLPAKGMPIDCGIGQWIIYGIADKPMTEKITDVSLKDSSSMFKDMMYGTDESEPKYIYIDEIPIISTDDKYIVCMQKMDTLQRMLIVGESGYGKSVLTDYLAGAVFYKWEHRVGWMMDPMNQFHSLSLPQDYAQFNKWNSVIGHIPKPMPAVQLYLASKGKIEFMHPNISLLLTLSFKELLYKFKIYSYGIDDWKIEGSTRYIYEHINSIKDIDDPDTIYSIMEDLMCVDFEKDEGNRKMVGKWVATFKTIWHDGFLSNLYKDDILATDELTIKYEDGSEFTGHPFLALLEAGAIPVINTSRASSSRWLRNYLADIIYKIYSHQSTSKIKKKVWIINDEMGEIYEKGRDLATDNFENLLFRRARFNDMGVIGNSQSLKKLNTEMFNNATHICCFYLKDAKDRRRVREAFGGSELARSVELDNIMRGLKKYEMVMFTKEPTVVYDRWGRRDVIKDKVWWKGRTFFPMNHHETPKGG